MKVSKESNRRTFLKGMGLLASALCVPGCATTSAPLSRRSNTHKILCANIRVPLEADDKAGVGWEMRKELCADIIRAQRADLVCLQECFGSQLDYLKSQMPEYESYGLSHVAPEYRPANAILFSPERYALVSAGGFWLSEKPHVAGSRSWDSAGPRFANWVELKKRIDGKVFRLWNMHLDHKGQAAREQQARVLCEAAEAAHPKEFPQLLTGDMNADVTNKAISLLKERGWKDTYAAVHGEKDPGFTYHRFLGPKFAEGRKVTLGKIDWIFARGPINTVSSEVIRDGRDGRFPSDHYFIAAEVEIN